MDIAKNQTITKNHIKKPHKNLQYSNKTRNFVPAKGPIAQLVRAPDS